MPRAVLSLALIVLAASPVVAESERPNVLFIAIDDLRPELGCYGVSRIHSPNIDKLAAEGTLFERAYCNIPVCGASRASLMTSIRPARGRFTSYRTWAERDAPNAKPLHTHFKEQGYYTVSLGKILHNPEDHVEGWSEAPWRPDRRDHYLRPENAKVHEKRRVESSPALARGPAWESADVSDVAYDGGQLARRAMEDLRRLKKREEPFFLAVGFFKPHLPFVAPKRYWDLYDREEISLPANSEIPKDAPKQAIHNSGELRNYTNIPDKGPISDEIARTLIHGYSACVSYTDAQIGKVLDELDRLGLRENTIIVLWSDHGWNLGEHTLWCKHCCFETSMRVPLIVQVPGMPGGRRCARLVELIDIYPSLCELAGLPLPDHLQGRSFVSLLENPDGDWKDFAVGRFGNGDTVRGDRYRFTEYTRGNGDLLSTMLYDHQTDSGETVNIVSQEALAADVERLTEELHERMGRKPPRAKAKKTSP